MALCLVHLEYDCGVYPTFAKAGYWMGDQILEKDTEVKVLVLAECVIDSIH
jgi:hypothetical protein